MSFDALARHYRWMERVLAGGKLQRARTAWLPRVGDARRVLLVGEGNGRFLSAALRALPEARFHCVDASRAMLRIALGNLSESERARVTFEVARLPDWEPSAVGFDWVVTHFFLDCFGADELWRVLEVLAGACAVEAGWLLADFAIPGSGMARVRARLIHRAMYAFFRGATRIPARRLTPPEPFLSRLGFRMEGVRELEWGLVRTSLWRRGGEAKGRFGE